MDSSLILTFVGLLISIYSLLSETNKRYVKYRLKKTDLFIIVFLFVSLLVQGWLNLNKSELNCYEKYYFYLSAINLLYVILMSFYIYSRLTTGKLYNKKRFIEDFYNNYKLKNYSQVILDMKEHFTLFKNDKNKELGYFLNNMCDDKLFVKEISERSPREGIEFFINNDIIRMESKKEFIREFYKELIINENSQLFYQLKTINDHFDYYESGDMDSHSYEVSVNEYFLHPFTNKELLSRSFLCNPIREAAHLYLKNQALKNRDENNILEEYVHFKNKWTNPIFICISFTDFVVREGIKNKIDDSMLLYMFTDIYDSILDNIEYTKVNLAEKKEWINNYEYYLYQIISNMIEWSISSIKNVKFFCPNIYNYTLLLLFSLSKDILDKEIRKEFQVNLVDRLVEMYLKIYKINNELGKGVLKRIEEEILENKILHEVIKNYDRPELWSDEEKIEAFTLLESLKNK